MVVNVDANGHALVRGIITSKTFSSDGSVRTIVINSWGGAWTIRTNVATMAIPQGSIGGGDLSIMPVGDFVGVDGQIAQDQMNTIDGTVVRDWTISPTGTGATSSSSSDSGSTASSTGAISYGTLYTGTASATDGTSTFTLTDSSGTAYTVTTNSDTILIDTNGDPITFSSIGNGDSIRLNGSLSGSSITATVVRDTAK
jgi:hypothetical protein